MAESELGNSKRPVRHRLLIGAACASALVCSVGISSPYASAAPSRDKPPTKQQVKQARNELADAGAAMIAAGKKLDVAAAQLPGAQNSLNRAQKALTVAQAARVKAVAALARSQAAVAQQGLLVAAKQREIDAIMLEIAVLARQAYIGGGDSRELQILLDSQDPSQFASKLASVKRLSQTNGVTFDRLSAAKAELAARLAQLQKLEDQARTDQEEAAAQAREATFQKDSAAAARASIASLVSQRRQALNSAAGDRAHLRKVYNRMLAARQLMSNGVTTRVGVRRTGPQAVQWAMKWVGSGANYNHLCLGFVDDAYGPTGSRVGRAIDQWDRAKAAGLAHPGDTTPPIGAQVFWWSGNPARHIALYAGNGMIISTGTDGDRVGLVPMSALDGYGPYLGWAPPYYP